VQNVKRTEIVPILLIIKFKIFHKIKLKNLHLSIIQAFKKKAKISFFLMMTEQFIQFNARDIICNKWSYKEKMF
jgi:hypothetical protein